MAAIPVLRVNHAAARASLKIYVNIKRKSSCRPFFAMRQIISSPPFSALKPRLIPYNYSVFGIYIAYIPFLQVKHVITSENFYTITDKIIRATQCCIYVSLRTKRLHHHNVTFVMHKTIIQHFLRIQPISLYLSVISRRYGYHPVFTACY